MTVAVAGPSKAAPVPRPSTFVLKQVMAITGGIFVGYVFVHMIGNLKVFFGAESFNAYAHWLREIGYPLIPHRGVLWALRVVLVLSLAAHVWAALALWVRGRRARGAHRRRRMPRLMASGARLMLPSGLLILVFVVVHLLDLTIGALVAPETFRSGDAYQNLVASFSRLWMAVCYSATMVFIAAHITHGWWTMQQDLGATGRRFRMVWITIGVMIALTILLGNALIPVLVQLGVIA
ncbi:MAG: succinate dehydrogenase cytochrome b subunit [Acidobacteriota bacterium]|nr:succinate dehydrogenase cytochrome b subunit [Acidobacteriota bacterium]